MHARRNRLRPRGFTLLEVLVSLLIFSFGVLGVVGLQARGVQVAVQAEDRTRAALMANEIVAQMWMQQSVTLPADTVTAWQKRVSDPRVAGLPNASGTIGAVDADGAVSVTIKWRPPSRDSADPDNQFITKVAMP